ncbi:MAG: sigma 54-interacting transcriptional regulator [Polyangiaceae bacterium]
MRIRIAKVTHSKLWILMSVPEELQMAELFGWKRGAFTGAVRDNPGAIARAGRGTLFIDEIDKLSLRAQAGLLRVIEERAYRPIGDDTRDQHAHARFVVGSNANFGGNGAGGTISAKIFIIASMFCLFVSPRCASGATKWQCGQTTWSLGATWKVAHPAMLALRQSLETCSVPMNGLAIYANSTMLFVALTHWLWRTEGTEQN